MALDDVLERATGVLLRNGVGTAAARGLVGVFPALCTFSADLVPTSTGGGGSSALDTETASATAAFLLVGFVTLVFLRLPSSTSRC